MKMNPLQTNRRVLIWLCAYPAPDSTNKWINLAQIAFTFTVFAMVMGYFIASAKFIIEYVRIDVELALYAMFQMAASIGDLYLIITAIILRHRIRDIFEGLKNIYKASKLSFHSTISKKVEEK